MIIARITSADKDWSRVRIICQGQHETYFLGNLAPHSDDLPEMLEDFKRAGWVIEDRREADNENNN